MIDLMKSHRPVLKSMTLLPIGMTALDEYYVQQFLTGDLFGDDPDVRIDKVELAHDEDYGGVYIYTSNFIKVGHWLNDDRYLQIMTKTHVYSEHGDTIEDHDPYDIPAEPITYREVELPGGVWRTAMNDPGRNNKFMNPNLRNVSLHDDWMQG